MKMSYQNQAIFYSGLIMAVFSGIEYLYRLDPESMVWCLAGFIIANLGIISELIDRVNKIEENRK